MMWKLKVEMDKEGHYDVEIEGGCQNRGIMMSN